MNLVHALPIGVVSAACRYTRCIVASWGFLAASERLMTGGEQRIPFRNLGACSGEDRDKLGALAPWCLSEEASNSWALHAGPPLSEVPLSLQDKVSEEGVWAQNNVCHLRFKTHAEGGWGCREKFE